MLCTKCLTLDVVKSAPPELLNHAHITSHSVEKAFAAFRIDWQTLGQTSSEVISGPRVDFWFVSDPWSLLFLYVRPDSAIKSTTCIDGTQVISASVSALNDLVTGCHVFYYKYILHILRLKREMCLCKFVEMFLQAPPVLCPLLSQAVMRTTPTTWTGTSRPTPPHRRPNACGPPSSTISCGQWNPTLPSTTTQTPRT